MGKLFSVSMDVLLRDELTLSEVKEVHGCGNNAIQGKRQDIYEGVLIKESVTDDTIIDLLNVHKIELMKTAPDHGGNWFVDFKAGNVKYIVFRDKILKYQIGDQAGKDLVCEECRKMGISDGEMNWPE